MDSAFTFFFGSMPVGGVNFPSAPTGDYDPSDYNHNDYHTE